MLMSGSGGTVNAKNSNRQIGEEVSMLIQIRLTPHKTSNLSRSEGQN